MASESSDSDEWAEGRVPTPTMQRLRLQRMVSGAGGGGEYEDAEDDDARGRSENPCPSQSQSLRERLVLKLKAKADGQMESQLEMRRPSQSTSTNLVMDSIALLCQAIQKLPQQRRDAGAVAAPAAHRREGAKRHRNADDTTATVSREQYLRLEEKYNILDKKYKDMQEKYYWLEKEALILVKMLTERGDVATPAPYTGTATHDDVDPAEEEAPARVGGARRVQLAPGVTLSRAQWRALQAGPAATHSRALVRMLALSLFGRRALLQYRDLEPKRMEILQDELRQRLANGRFSEEAAKRLTPAATPRYVQRYRAQLRMQAKRQRASVRDVGTICGECNKRFLSRSHLEVHARIHSGERPYSCSECDDAFMFHAQFNQHARAHRSARARVCPRCGAAFPQLAHLHWHARRAHAAPPPPLARRHKPVKPHPAWLRVPLRDDDDLAELTPAVRPTCN